MRQLFAGWRETISGMQPSLFPEAQANDSTHQLAGEPHEFQAARDGPHTLTTNPA